MVFWDFVFSASGEISAHTNSATSYPSGASFLNVGPEESALDAEMGVSGTSQTKLGSFGGSRRINTNYRTQIHNIRRVSD
jgi:hypothetical protein